MAELAKYLLAANLLLAGTSTSRQPPVEATNTINFASPELVRVYANSCDDVCSYGTVEILYKGKDDPNKTMRSTSRFLSPLSGKDVLRFLRQFNIDPLSVRIEVYCDADKKMAIDSFVREECSEKSINGTPDKIL